MALKAKQENPKNITIHFEIPLHRDRDQFINKAMCRAQKIARRIHNEEFQTPKKKGGRPTLEKKIWATCDDIWKEWEKKQVPRRHRTKTRLLDEVEQRTAFFDKGTTKKKTLNNKTIEKHVSTWLNVFPRLKDLPARTLLNRFRDPRTLFTRANGVLLTEGIKIYQEYATKRIPELIQAGKSFKESLSPETQKDFDKAFKENQKIRKAQDEIKRIKFISKDPSSLKLYKQHLREMIKAL